MKVMMNGKIPLPNMSKSTGEHSFYELKDTYENEVGVVDTTEELKMLLEQSGIDTKEELLSWANDHITDTTLMKLLVQLIIDVM